MTSRGAKAGLSRFMAGDAKTISGKYMGGMVEDIQAKMKTEMQEALSGDLGPRRSSSKRKTTPAPSVVKKKKQKAASFRCMGGGCDTLVEKAGTYCQTCVDKGKEKEERGCLGVNHGEHVCGIQETPAQPKLQLRTTIDNFRPRMSMAAFKIYVNHCPDDAEIPHTYFREEDNVCVKCGWRGTAIASHVCPDLA
jgi:hypothetical protein